jgi:resuscitation-promoting factor RpfB
MRRLIVPLAVAALLLAPVPPDRITGGASVEAASCTAGYKPCIANKASDVDCYGGSGNGPRYTRPGVVYTVRRGYDRYRLDADHDGEGCERR